MRWPVALVLVAACACAGVAMRAQSASPDASHQPSAISHESGVYVGSDACQRCHGPEYDTWRETLHVQMTKPIAEARIEGDFRAGTRLDEDQSLTV